jgi:hypothetical protein
MYLIYKMKLKLWSANSILFPLKYPIRKDNKVLLTKFNYKLRICYEDTNIHINTILNANLCDDNIAFKLTTPTINTILPELQPEPRRSWGSSVRVVSE